MRLRDLLSPLLRAPVPTDPAGPLAHLAELGARPRLRRRQPAPNTLGAFVAWCDPLGEAARAAGLAAADLSGHSLCAGLITQAAKQGKTERDTMRHTGHRSAATLRRYIRAAELFALTNPAQGIGLQRPPRRHWVGVVDPYRVKVVLYQRATRTPRATTRSPHLLHVASGSFLAKNRPAPENRCDRVGEIALTKGQASSGSTSRTTDIKRQNGSLAAQLVSR